MKDSADLPRFEHLSLAEDTTRLEQAAARLIHRTARDADDEHLLLNALGLLPDNEPRTEATP